MDKRPLDNLVENRDEVRYSLSGKLPVRFLHDSKQEEFEALFVDISQGGLGLLVNEQVLNIGETVSMLSDAGKTYRFEVIWLKRTRMRGTASELVRAGLHCLQSEIDLLQEFADTSLIDM